MYVKLPAMNTGHFTPQHPGEHLRIMLSERSMSQRDLAFILGQNPTALSYIMAGKRGVSADMSKALGDALGVAPDFFAKLQADYDISRADEPDRSVGIRAAILSKYPIREMIRRGWLAESDAGGEDIQQQLARFFQISDPDQIPYLSHAARKTDYASREISPAQLAWLFRVKQIASSMAAPPYSASSLLNAVDNLRDILTTVEDARRVPRILMEAGVRFIVVETLPEAKIDGVCFWLDESSPVIGMSTRYDRMDNFYFVLRHEIEHVLRNHARGGDVVDAELEGVNAGTDETMPEEERVANFAAAEFCVPNDKIESFLRRKHPFYYEKDVLLFAQLNKRHPALVVGQMQRRLSRYDYLRKYQVRIRHYVLPSAIVDGWGQSVPTV